MVQQKTSGDQSKLSHSGADEDGIMPLSDNELESVAGGKGAMAQDQIVTAEIQALEQYQNKPAVLINNHPDVSINTVSLSSIGSIGKK